MRFSLTLASRPERGHPLTRMKSLNCQTYLRILAGFLVIILFDGILCIYIYTLCIIIIIIIIIIIDY